MDKSGLSERYICTKFIMPALRKDFLHNATKILG